MIGYINRLRAKKGFTMVELIIVIAIIGILMALILPTIFRDDKPTKAKGYAKAYYYTVQDFMSKKRITDSPVTSKAHFPELIGEFAFYTTVDKSGHAVESGLIALTGAFSASSARPCDDIESGAITIPHAPFRELIIDFGRYMENYVTTTEFAGTFYAIVTEEFVVKGAYWADGDIGEISSAGNTNLVFSDDNLLSSGYVCCAYPTELSTVSGVSQRRMFDV